MMYNLLEDNKTVEYYIQNLDSLIIKLKDSELLNKNPKLYKYIEGFYNTLIKDWVENYNLWNKDLDKEDEENLINEILDLNNLIKKTLNIK